MGEAADPILNGDMTEDGEWLGGGRGYPRGGPGYEDEAPRRRRKRDTQTTHAPTRKPKEPPVLVTRYAELGFQVAGDPFHWQAMTPLGKFHWWPRAGKFGIGQAIRQGTDDQAVKALLVARQVDGISPPGGRYPSPNEIERGMTGVQGWSRTTLESWGVPWPPPKGWRKRLEAGYAMQRREEGNG